MFNRMLVLWILFCLSALPLQAQDHFNTNAYQNAVARIEAARIEGDATVILYGLHSIPPELWELTHLRGLSIGRGYLEQLPAEIGQLVNLEILIISGNNLTTLPPEIGQLSNLKVLLVSESGLQSLPPEIGQLQALRALGLDRNNLQALPESMGNLEHLVRLSVRWNRLTQLPLTLGKVKGFDETDYFMLEITNPYDQVVIASTSLPGLYVEGNPLAAPPAEVVALGSNAIVAYLRDEQAKLDAERNRMLLAGSGAISLLGILMFGFGFKQRTAQKPKKKRAIGPELLG